MMRFIINYWYVPILILIFLTGIVLTINLKGIQFRKMGLAFKLMLKSSSDGTGEVSTFQALCISLSATLGTGNIIGVSTALALGGAGSLFWMFIFAVVGLATKYAEGYLAIKYRKISDSGEVIGVFNNCIAGNSSCNGRRGNYVVIRHNVSNYYTVYMHLHNIYVKVGDKVKQGDVIGKVSTSAKGESNDGNHLHFEVLVDNVKTDPTFNYKNLSKLNSLR